MAPDIRWKQRLQSYQQALSWLHDALDGDWEHLSVLEKQGVVQRFEITLELGWNVLKDYLLWTGVALNPLTPRTAVKEGYRAGILQDGQIWIDMLDHRNLLAHTYDGAVFESAVRQIVSSYLHAFDHLLDYLRNVDPS